MIKNSIETFYKDGKKNGQYVEYRTNGRYISKLTIKMIN